jgi:predicted MFS family arabinose efflux permease
MKQLWQERRDFRQLILTRLLLDFELIALPYYSTYAVTVLGAKPSLLGTFIVAETVGGMFANALWSTLADRKSNLFVLQSAALLMALPSGWVLLLSACHFLFGLPVLPLYPLTYFFLALAMTGISIAFTNYVLEIADDAHRPTYLALSNASESGMMMLPVLGGILLKFVPHPVLFAIAFTGALIAARQSRRLRPAFATIPPRRFPVAP